MPIHYSQPPSLRSNIYSFRYLEAVEMLEGIARDALTSRCTLATRKTILSYQLVRTSNRLHSFMSSFSNESQSLLRG